MPKCARRACCAGCWMRVRPRPRRGRPIRPSCSANGSPTNRAAVCCTPTPCTPPPPIQPAPKPCAPWSRPRPVPAPTKSNLRPSPPPACSRPGIWRWPCPCSLPATGPRPSARPCRSPGCCSRCGARSGSSSSTCWLTRWCWRRWCSSVCSSRTCGPSTAWSRRPKTTAARGWTRSGPRPRPMRSAGWPGPSSPWWRASRRTASAWLRLWANWPRRTGSCTPTRRRWSGPRSLLRWAGWPRAWRTR